MINVFPRSVVVWDFETTGLSPQNDRIVEAAVAIVRDGLVVEQWSSLIKIDCDIDPRAQEVHGITKEMCESEGKEEREVLGRLRQNIYDCEAHVTHNGTRFDLLFLNNALERLGLDIDQQVLHGKHIDTAALYKAIKMNVGKDWMEPWPRFFARVLDARVPGLKYNVGVCCDDLGISRDGIQQHRSLGDVLLTAQIYDRLTSLVLH